MTATISKWFAHFFDLEFWQTVIFQSIDSSTGFNLVNGSVAKKLGADVKIRLVQSEFHAIADIKIRCIHYSFGWMNEVDPGIKTILWK